MAHPQLSTKTRGLGRLLALVELALATAGLAPPAPTQAQVARRFLGELVRAEYPAAYQRLAPEVRATLRPATFAAAAQPLGQLGEQRGQALELYSWAPASAGAEATGSGFIASPLPATHSKNHRPCCWK